MSFHASTRLMASLLVFGAISAEHRLSAALIAQEVDETSASPAPDSPTMIVPEYFKFPAEMANEKSVQRLRTEIDNEDKYREFTSLALQVNLRCHILERAVAAQREQQRVAEEVAKIEASLKIAKRLDAKAEIEGLEAQLRDLRDDPRSAGLVGLGTLRCEFAPSFFVTGIPLATAGEQANFDIQSLNSMIIQQALADDCVDAMKRDWIDPLKKIQDAASKNDLARFNKLRDAMLCWILDVKSLAPYRVEWKSERA